jgi:hypothetical protein
MTTRAELIEVLEKTQAALVSLTTGASEADLDARTGPDEWSVREILAHLVDDEMYVMRLRAERMVKEANPQLIPHDEKHWYANRNTTRDSLAELLGDFATQRAASLGILKMLRESDWQRAGFQPEYGQLTVESWLTNWANHDIVHIEQIQKSLAVHRQSK